MTQGSCRAALRSPRRLFTRFYKAVVHSFGARTFQFPEGLRLDNKLKVQDAAKQADAVHPS